MTWASVCSRRELFHSIQNRSHDSTNHTAFHRSPLAATRQVLINDVGQSGNRQSLQPDSSRAGERGQKNSISPKDHVLNAWNGCDLKRDTRLKCANMPRMNPQSLSGL